MRAADPCVCRIARRLSGEPTDLSGGGMSDGTKAKRRVAARRLLQSTWRLVAFPFYRIGKAGANLSLSFLPIALDGAGYGAALLWGGPLQ